MLGMTPGASRFICFLALRRSLAPDAPSLVAAKDLVQAILIAVGRPVQTCGTKVQLSRVLASSTIFERVAFGRRQERLQLLRASAAIDDNIQRLS